MKLENNLPGARPVDIQQERDLREVVLHRLIVRPQIEQSDKDAIQTGRIAINTLAFVQRLECIGFGFGALRQFPKQFFRFIVPFPSRHHFSELE